MIDIALSNGVVLPALGFGVFQSSPEETAAAVETAIATGYRRIDTAAVYGNERDVGEGIRRSGVDRDEVVVETKVWVSDYGFDETLHAFEKSAAKLDDRRADPPPARPGAVRPDDRRVPNPAATTRRGPGAGHRREQLPAAAPLAVDRRDRRRATASPVPRWAARTSLAEAEAPRFGARGGILL
jgi:hypothetical protein